MSAVDEESRALVGNDDDLITPVDAFYVRDRGAPPAIDPQRWRVDVGGRVGRRLWFSLSGLVDTLPAREVIATMYDNGRGRTPGIGTARWRGVDLSDLLRVTGVVEKDAVSVVFTGHQQVKRAGELVPFSAGIPLEVARSGRVILAYEMNDAPLLPRHGAPVRVVVPGYVGACSVKWLARIEVRDRPAEPTFHPEYPSGELPLVARTEGWRSGDAAGGVTIHGWAIAPGVREVVRVEVSFGDEERWRAAEVVAGAGMRGVWKRWQLEVDAERVGQVLSVRAFDDTGRRSEPSRTRLEPA